MDVDDATWLMMVDDYAELHKGCDPIGASDLLGDLLNYARYRLEIHGQIDPAVVWDEFMGTETFRQYGLKPW